MSDMIPSVSRSTHLDKLDDLLPKDFKQLDVLGYTAKLFHGCVLLFLFLAFSLFRDPVYHAALKGRVNVLLRLFYRAGPRILALCLFSGRLMVSLIGPLPRQANLFRQSFCSSFFLPLRLFWVLALCFARSIGSQSIDEGNDDKFDVDFGVKLGRGG